jgi:hypothetical protein
LYGNNAASGFTFSTWTTNGITCGTKIYYSGNVSGTYSLVTTIDGIQKRLNNCITILEAAPDENITLSVANNHLKVGTAQTVDVTITGENGVTLPNLGSAASQMDGTGLSFSAWKNGSSDAQSVTNF